MKSRAARFLDAFRDIEQHLRAAVTGSDQVNFTAVLSAAIAKMVPGASRYQHELRQFAMLRNAIFHRATSGGQPIADPRSDVVRQIEEIRAVLLTAPSLTSVLLSGVTVTTADSTMAEASGRMLEGDFSQLPVLSDGRVIDLLTTDAVSRWMTAELFENGHVRLETPVQEVVRFDRDRSYEPVDQSANVLTALDLFAAHEERGEMLHAILVSRSLPSGPLVAIATVTDLPRIMAAAVPLQRSHRR